MNLYPTMRITLDFGTAGTVEISGGELVAAFRNAIDIMMAERLNQASGDAGEGEPARCRHCEFGLIFDRDEAGHVTHSKYCQYCPMGRDLKRVEARVPRPVGGADGE